MVSYAMIHLKDTIICIHINFVVVTMKIENQNVYLVMDVTELIPNIWQNLDTLNIEIFTVKSVMSILPEE
jgi:hypothetical protein